MWIIIAARVGCVAQNPGDCVCGKPALGEETVLACALSYIRGRHTKTLGPGQHRSIAFIVSEVLEDWSTHRHIETMQLHLVLDASKPEARTAPMGKALRESLSRQQASLLEAVEDGFELSL